MRVWHAAGLKPRLDRVRRTKSGFQSPPTRKSGTKLTVMGRTERNSTDNMLCTKTLHTLKILDDFQRDMLYLFR